MDRGWQFVVCGGLFCLAASTPLAAEPVSITSGTLVLTGRFQPGWISLVGTEGFSLEARVVPSEGRIDPLTECAPLCDPGATISVGGFLGHPAFVGTGTFAGNSFELTGAFTDPVGVHLEFAGTARLPSSANAATVVMAPFTALGGVFDADAGTVALIRAGGIVTLWLAPGPPDWNLPNGWTVSQMQYDFGDTAAPIPEPATMVLLGTGLAVTALRARRRRAAG